MKKLFFGFIFSLLGFTLLAQTPVPVPVGETKWQANSRDTLHQLTLEAVGEWVKDSAGISVGGDNIYNTDGTLADGRRATLEDDGDFAIDYFGGQEAFLVTDGEGVSFFSPNGLSSIEVSDNYFKLLSESGVIMETDNARLWITADTVLLLPNSGNAPVLALREAAANGTSSISFSVADNNLANSFAYEFVDFDDPVTNGALVHTGGGAIEISKINLTSMVSNTLPVGNGGTGATTLTTGALLQGNGTSAVSALALGTANQLVGMNSGASGNEYKTLALGTTAQSNDLGIVHAANSITLHIPNASATARGVITAGTQTIGGRKDMTGLTTNFASTHSSIHIVGTPQNAHTTFNSNQTLSNAYNTIKCDCTSGAVTLTAPANSSTTRGFTYTVVKTDATSNPCIFDLNGSNTFTDGSTQKVLLGQNTRLVVSLGETTNDSFYQ